MEFVVRFVFKATMMLALLAALWSAPVAAQDDPNDAPLGDVARNLRSNKPSTQQVIDNDNLDQVMDDVQSHRLTGASLLYSMDGSGKNFNVSVPDATCSLSFTANAKALLSSQYVQLDLPASELAKLDGPATIAGDSLQVSVYNATDWHVSEIDVVVTLVKKDDPADGSGNSGSSVPASTVPGENASGNDASAKLIPASDGIPLPSPLTPKPNYGNQAKRPDATYVYKMRAPAAPYSVAVFSAPLNVEIAPGQEWHWAIVTAKGYPPQRTMLPDPQQAKVQQP